MGIPKFFRLPQNKRFNYRPIYYDPVKEAREERKKEIEKNADNLFDVRYAGRLRRGAMREHYDRAKKVNRQSNIRLVLIIIVLLFITYLLLYR